MRGAFLWGLQTMRNSYQDKMRALAAVGVDTIWFMLNYLDDENSYANPRNPYGIAGYWKPWLAVDAPGPDDPIPIWDLGVRNPDFIASLRDKLQVMHDIGLVPAFMFDDLCSEGGEGSWQQLLDPYYSNTLVYPEWQHPEQMVDVAPDGSKSLRRAVGGGNQSASFTPMREKLEHEVYDLCMEIGFPKVYGNPKNEYGYQFGPAYPKSEGVKWLKARCDHLRSIGYIVVTSWRPEMTAADCEPFSDLLDQHQIITPDDLARSESTPWPSKIIVDTDGKSGTGPIVSAYGGRTIGDDQAKTLGEDVARRGLLHWVITPQEMMDKRDDCTNADPIRTEPFEAMARATGWTPPPPPVEYVTVTVDTFTNQLANPYCPVTATVQYVKGTEPTTVCTLHTAPPIPPTPPPVPWWLKILRWLFGWL